MSAKRMAVVILSEDEAEYVVQGLTHFGVYYFGEALRCLDDAKAEELRGKAEEMRKIAQKFAETDAMTARDVKKIVGRRVDTLSKKISELSLVTPVDEKYANLLTSAIDRHKRERERLVILLESMKA